MFDQLRKDDSAQSPNPQTTEPSLPEKVTKAIIGCAEKAGLNLANDRLNNWVFALSRGGAKQGDKKVDGLSATITFEVQERLGYTATANAATDDQAKDSPIEHYQWLQTECIASAAQRAALAQRSFAWMLTWQLIGQSLPPQLEPGHPLRVSADAMKLIGEVSSASADINALTAQIAGTPMAARPQIVNRKSVLESRQSAARFILGGMVVFAPYLVPANTSLPSDLPPRSLNGCLSRGNAWLLHQLSENGAHVEHDKINHWTDSGLMRQLKMLPNGMTEESTPEVLRVMAATLGVSLITDADGVTQCVVKASEAVRKATADPNATLCAAYLETHTLTILNLILDRAFVHPSTSTPLQSQQDIPKPDASLAEKCNFLWRIWAIRNDPS